MIRLQYLILSTLAIIATLSTFPFVLSYEYPTGMNQPAGDFIVPTWIKNNAGWWSDGQIDDNSFVSGLQWLISNDIITLPPTDQGTNDGENVIPNWVKNTAGWWADDKIYDITFVSAIKYLVGEGIIIIEQEIEESAEASVEEPVEIKEFSMIVNPGGCDSCLSWAHVGDKYHFQIMIFDGSGPIDEVAITADIFSKSGVLRHDFGTVTTEDGIYTNSITIPNMDWFGENILSITGEYDGIEKTIEKEFTVFASKNSNNAGVTVRSIGSCGITSAASVNSNGQSETQTHGFAFSSDGQRMFVIGSTTDRIWEYDLSVNGAYCISDLSTNLITTFSKDGTPSDITFSPNGNQMFVLGQVNNTVYEYALSERWLANSTASYLQSFNIANEETTAHGLTFSNNGKKMFIVGAQTGEVNEYKLTNKFDVSSASFVQVLDISSTDNAPTGITFNPNGKKMFVTGNQNDSVYEYELTNKFDVASASLITTLDVSSEDNTPRDIFFSSNGEVMYILGKQGGDITVYQLSEPFDLRSASVVS